MNQTMTIYLDLPNQQHHHHCGILVRCSFCPFDSQMLTQTEYRVEEAGHYLSTYKQFEHRPPDMIKERVDKDHLSILRSSLTSISKVNKTDVETLRSAFGVRSPPLVLRFSCLTV